MIWERTQVFVRRDVIFNESKFCYKDGKNSEPEGENSTTDLVTLADIFHLVAEGHLVGSI